MQPKNGLTVGFVIAIAALMAVPASAMPLRTVSSSPASKALGDGVVAHAPSGAALPAARSLIDPGASAWERTPVSPGASVSSSIAEVGRSATVSPAASDPLTLEGGGGGVCDACTQFTVSAILQQVHANDLLVLVVSDPGTDECQGGPYGLTVTDIYDSLVGTDWQLRMCYWDSNPVPISEYEFYGVSSVNMPGTFTDTIRIAYTQLPAGVGTNSSAVAFAVSGENPSDPWAIPAPVGAWGSSANPGISTPFEVPSPGDMVLGLLSTSSDITSVSSETTPLSFQQVSNFASDEETLTWAEEAIAPGIGFYPPSATLNAAPYSGWRFLGDIIGGSSCCGNETAPCCRVVANPVVGETPGGEAYDPRTNEVFVSNFWAWNPTDGDSTVSVLSGTYPYSAIPASPVKVGPWPAGEAYDPVTSTVWVVNLGGDSISEICDGSGTYPCLTGIYVLQTLQLPSEFVEPTSIAYDPIAQVMAVTADVSPGTGPPALLIVPVDGAPISIVDLGSSSSGYWCSVYATSCGPSGVAFDYKDNEFFVSQPGFPSKSEGEIAAGLYAVYWSTGAEWAVSPCSGAPALAPVDPGLLAWDSRTDQLFVADDSSATDVPGVDVVDAFPGGATYDTVIPLGTDAGPAGIAYDAPCNLVYVADHGGGAGTTVSAISDVTDQVVSMIPVGDGPNGVVYDYGATYESVNGAVFVSNYDTNYDVGNGNVSVIFCAFCLNETNVSSVTFVPFGLPTGSSWDVEAWTYGGTELLTESASSPAPIAFEVPAGSLLYSFSSPAGYGVWQVTGAPPGSSGTLLTSALVSGPTVLDVYFHTTCDYTATFNETGLLVGATWDITLNGTTIKERATTTGGASITFSGLCVGKNYPFKVSSPKGYRASPSSGTITIPTNLPAGGEVYQTIVFLNPCAYTATFNETGLPVGATWDIKQDGKTIKETVTTTGGMSITFPGLCVGRNYTYKVSTPKGYTASPPNGTISIPANLSTGSEVYQNITFATLPCPSPQTGGELGDSVAISGSMVVVGAPGETASGYSAAGYACVFKSGDLWATLTSPNAQDAGGFGASVAISGNLVMVGAPDETAAGHAAAGHAYLFTTMGVPLQTYTSPNAGINGNFGASVGISGKVVVVGAPFDSTSNGVSVGAAYTFTTGDILLATISGPSYGVQLGASVAISGNTIAVGAPYEAASGHVDAGQAYTFTKWGVLLATLSNPNPQFEDLYGGSVAISGNTVVVGAPSAGQAYTFTTMGVPLATLSPPGGPGGQFGISVAISGKTVVVGASVETAGGYTEAGLAYTFTTMGAPLATLTSPNAQPQGFFGGSVAISGSTIVVGAPGETVAGYSAAGHWYWF